MEAGVINIYREEVGFGGMGYSGIGLAKCLWNGMEKVNFPLLSDTVIQLGCCQVLHVLNRLGVGVSFHNASVYV
jgi:hypothetical protein